MEANQNNEASLNFSSWNRARTDEELRSFVSQHFSALTSVEVE